MRRKKLAARAALGSKASEAQKRGVVRFVDVVAPTTHSPLRAQCSKAGVVNLQGESGVQLASDVQE